MTLLAAFALAAATSTAALPSSVPHCAWDRPGHRAFLGDVVAAVDRYQDIPAEVRARLMQRMATRRYDDIARIERDRIAGRYDYAPDLREMHFADGQVCARVSRERWAPDAVERGLVYCESGHCIIVPTVCRNVARVTRLGERVAAGAAASDDVLPLARGAAAAATPPIVVAPAATTTAPGPQTSLPQSAVATPAPASFEQLAPDLAKQAAALAAPSPAPVIAEATPAPMPVQPSAPGGAGPLLPQVLQEPTPALVGDLRPVLPILAWTTPFGNGLIPIAARDNNGQPQPVPEADAWVMWLAGLAVVVFLARRRRR